MSKAWLSLVVLGAGLAAQAPRPEAFSPQGRAYFSKPDTNGVVENADLALAKSPISADLLLAAARARDSLLRFSESIPLYSRGIDEYPNDVRFWRFRGHRFISTRKFDFAIADLKKAAEMAPASFDIAYHLGLAYYLRGDYNHSAREYQRCLAMAPLAKPSFLKGLPANWRACHAMDDDSKVAISEWTWRTLSRAGKHDEAAKVLNAVGEKMDVKENQSYFKTLLLYKGLRTPEQIVPAEGGGNAAPTIDYGVGLWHFLEGRKEKACAAWRSAAADTENWSAFGLIAAEIELTRGHCPAPKKR